MDEFESKSEFQPTAPNPEDMPAPLDDGGEAAAANPHRQRVRQTASGRSANTGPKGVKEDFEEAKLKMRARRLEKKLLIERAITRTAVGNERFVVEESKLVRVSADSDSDKSQGDNEEELESDDEAFQQYRLQRIQAMQPVKAGVSGPGYIVKAVNKTIVSRSMMPGYDEFGLSTIVLYRGGRQIEVLVRVQDEIGTNFSDRDVATLLSRKGVLSSTCAENGAAAKVIASALSASASLGSKNTQITKSLRMGVRAKDSDDD